MMEFNQDIAVTGIIMPHNWDKNGKVVEIALYTNTEKVYPVELCNTTQELTNLIHRCVEIKGKMREHPDGNKSIVVQNYMVLEEIINQDIKTR